MNKKPNLKSKYEKVARSDDHINGVTIYQLIIANFRKMIIIAMTKLRFPLKSDAC